MTVGGRHEDVATERGTSDMTEATRFSQCVHDQQRRLDAEDCDSIRCTQLISAVCCICLVIIKRHIMSEKHSQIGYWRTDTRCWHHHTTTVQGIRNDDQSLSPVTPLISLLFLSFLIP